MTWWAWTLLWIVLVLGAAGFLFLAARRLFRQGMALARELGTAADTLAEVTRALEDLPGTSSPPAPDRPPARATRPGPGRAARPQDVR